MVFYVFLYNKFFLYSLYNKFKQCSLLCYYIIIFDTMTDNINFYLYIYYIVLFTLLFIKKTDIYLYTKRKFNSAVNKSDSLLTPS